jgi:hypothetical protein
VQAVRDAGTLQLGLFDERDLAEVTDPAYPGERLVVCRNPDLGRLARVRMRSAEDGADFDRFETPTPVQGKALSLLGVGV